MVLDFYRNNILGFMVDDFDIFINGDLVEVNIVNLVFDVCLLVLNVVFILDYSGLMNFIDIILMEVVVI